MCAALTSAPPDTTPIPVLMRRLAKDVDNSECVIKVARCLRVMCWEHNDACAAVLANGGAALCGEALKAHTGKQVFAVEKVLERESPGVGVGGGDGVDRTNRSPPSTPP